MMPDITSEDKVYSQQWAAGWLNPAAYYSVGKFMEIYISKNKLDSNDIRKPFYISLYKTMLLFMLRYKI